jgi:hypothetical protein
VLFRHPGKQREISHGNARKKNRGWMGIWAFAQWGNGQQVSICHLLHSACKVTAKYGEK